MGWRIELEPRALKELEAQDRQVQRGLLAFLRDAELGRFWKYRVGDWRLVCDIRDQQVTVIVARLGHRREVYGR